MLRITKVGGGGGSGSGGDIWKGARSVATIEPLPAYTRVDNTITGDAPGALPLIDGATIGLNESFLLLNGASPIDNGLWTVTVVGDGATPYQLTRSSDANTDAEMMSGLQIPITTGTFAGRVTYLSTPDPVVLNTTPLTFSIDTGSVWSPVSSTTVAAPPAYTRVGNVITGNAVGALPAIDGVAMSVNSSFLLRNGAANADNGIWSVARLGDGASTFQLIRSPEANISSLVTSGKSVRVLGGSFAGLSFRLATANPINLNTTGLSFTLDTALPSGITRALPVATGAYANNDQIPAPDGPTVIAEFTLDQLPLSGAVLEGIVLVSQGALTGHLKLYDVTAGADVAGSPLSTSSLTGARLTSGDLTALLVAGRRYQIIAECTGGVTVSDWAVIRYATLVPS